MNPQRHNLMSNVCVRWRQAPPRKRVRVDDLPWPTKVQVLDGGARVANLLTAMPTSKKPFPASWRHRLASVACAQAPPRKRVRVDDLPWHTKVQVLDEGARVGLHELNLLRLSSARKADAESKKSAGRTMGQEGRVCSGAAAAAAPGKPRGKAGAPAGAAKGKGKEGAGPKGKEGAGPKGKEGAGPEAKEGTGPMGKKGPGPKGKAGAGPKGKEGGVAGASKDKEGAHATLECVHNPEGSKGKSLGSELSASA